MSIRNKIYFASDFHLGAGSYDTHRAKELKIISWLDMIKADAAELYLVGDIFDFWFEYATVVPKGYVRFLGKLAELSDAGVKLTLFKGNHDMWMFGYFVQELGATIVSDELVIERNGKKFYIHHGDGLGPGDLKYKIMKKFFRSSLCQWLFERVHPNFGVGIANYWSRHSRKVNIEQGNGKVNEHEWLVTYSKEVLQTQFYDYLVFGHRHLAMDVKLNDKSRYINLGEWFDACTYAAFDGEDMTVHTYTMPANL